jgi:hypothetical protein
MSWIRVFGVSTIIVINILLVTLVGLIFLEFNIENPDNKRTYLYQTEYYNHPQLGNPYWSFAIKKIHPYYIFSTPYKKSDIEAVNNSVASLNNEGFRKINNKERQLKKVLMLGGSVAFGHYASSNDKTIGAILNKNLPYQVVNRNAPSWNSHQESIALYKYRDLENVEASVSLTLANDLGIYCTERLSGDAGDPIDSPESWTSLLSIQDKPIVNKEPFSIWLTIKSLSYKLFPNIYTNLSRYKGETLKYEDKAPFYKYCNNKHVGIIADSFLFNQKQMSKVAKSYGFKHFLVIQPMYSLHQELGKFNKLSENDIYFVKNVVKYIMNSDYCNNNPCLDLSAVFDNGNYFMHTFTGNNKKEVDDWLNNGIFIDEVHINDRGNKIISDRIGSFLLLNNAYKLR